MTDKKLMDYYIDHTNQRLDKIEEKLDKVLSFRWQIIGGAASISFFISLIAIVVKN